MSDPGPGPAPRRPVATLRQAVDAGDADRAVAATEALVDRPVEAVLEDLRLAVEEERYEDARGLLATVIDHYRSLRRSERARLAAVERLRTDDSTPYDRARELGRYRRLAIETKRGRSAVVAATSALVDAPEDPSTPSPGTVADRVGSAADREREFGDATADVESELSSASLPPTVTVIDLSVESARIGTGDTVDLSVTVANVGDEAADGVAVDLTAPDGVTAAEPRVELGAIPAGEETGATVPVTGAAPGSYSITARVSGDGAAGSVRTAELTVAGTGAPGPVERADTNDDGEISVDELRAAIVRWARGEYTTEELQEIIVAWTSG